MSNIIEKWLTQMSLNGFALIYNNWWKFVFVETSPKHREYCLYSGFDASKGIWADYYLAKKLCGKTKGKLLKNTYGIFEIDTKKDKQMLYQFKKIRKKHYVKHYFGLFMLTLFFSFILLVLSYLNKYCIILYILCLVLVIYYLVSLIVSGTHQSGDGSVIDG